MHDETTLQRACLTPLHFKQVVGRGRQNNGYHTSCTLQLLKTSRKLYFHVCKVTEKPDSTPLRVCEEEKAASWGRGFARPSGGKDVSTDPGKRTEGRERHARAREEHRMDAPEGSNCGPYSRTPQSRLEPD